MQLDVLIILILNLPHLTLTLPPLHIHFSICYLPACSTSLDWNRVELVFRLLIVLITKFNPRISSRWKIRHPAMQQPPHQPHSRTITRRLLICSPRCSVSAYRKSWIRSRPLSWVFTLQFTHRSLALFADLPATRTGELADAAAQLRTVHCSDGSAIPQQDQEQGWTHCSE